VAEMVTRDSAGTQYCDDVMGKPLDQFQIEPDQLRIIKESLIFNASTHVGKVIFIATPNQGADRTSGLIGRLGSRLVRLPAKLVAIGPRLVEKATATITDIAQQHVLLVTNEVSQPQGVGDKRSPQLVHIDRTISSGR
jgi:hypothetical protein